MSIELPNQYLELIRQQIGSVEALNFLKSFDEPFVRGLRVNTLKDVKINDIDGINRKIKELDFAYYINQESLAGKSILHEMGAYYIQEPSAMIPALVLNPKANEKILDLCAAPGGKSTQIAIAMKNTGLLISNEAVKNRALILSSNIKRMGITNTIITSMLPDKLTEVFGEYFDAILVDAPCSGEGMFRKHPEVISEWSIEKVFGCATRQHDILKNALKMLKPGGRLVYSTCTMNKIENEELIDKFVCDNLNIKLEPFNFGGNIVSTTGYLKLWQHKFKGEGHFIAQIKKEYSETKQENSMKFKKSQKISKEEMNIFKDFVNKNNIGGFLPNFKFNDILFQVPFVELVDNANIVDAGLRLGCIKYNMFVPEHSFAQAINNTTKVVNIALNEKMANKYITGESIEVENTEINGYVLLTYNNNSLAWGKIKDGVIKNHYPKHLRKNL